MSEEDKCVFESWQNKIIAKHFFEKGIKYANSSEEEKKKKNFEYYFELMEIKI